MIPHRNVCLKVLSANSSFVGHRRKEVLFKLNASHVLFIFYNERKKWCWWNLFHVFVRMFGESVFAQQSHTVVTLILAGHVYLTEWLVKSPRWCPGFDPHKEHIWTLISDNRCYRMLWHVAIEIMWFTLTEPKHSLNEILQFTDTHVFVFCDYYFFAIVNEFINLDYVQWILIWFL